MPAAGSVAGVGRGVGQGAGQAPPDRFRTLAGDSGQVRDLFAAQAFDPAAAVGGDADDCDDGGGDAGSAIPLRPTGAAAPRR